MTNVLRTAYVNVAPNTDGFDVALKEKLRRADPGGKAGKLVGSQLNAALRRVDVQGIDIAANPAQALAAIAVTEERLKALSRDSATVEVKIHTERALTQLQRFKKQLGDVGGEAGPEAASGFAAQFSQRLGPLLAKAPLSGPVAISLAGAAVLAAPLIGATVSGAVIGGAGIGGVVGGLVLASKDPRVKAAATQVGDRLKDRLTAAGSSFVGPALDGLNEIESALSRINIEGILRDSSQFVRPLTEGISVALVDLGGGIEKLIHNAGPVVDSIGRGIAAIGQSLGDGLASLSDNGDAAASALDVVFSAIRTGVDSVFLVVNGLTEVYGWLKRIGALGVFAHLGEMMDGTGDSARKMAAGMNVGAATAEQLATAQKAVSDSQGALQGTLDQVTGKMSQSSLAANTLKSAMDGLFGAAIRQTDANEAYQASWDGLTGSVKENGRTLNIHTVAGRSNRDALEGLLTSTNDLYTADIAAGVSVAAATKKHEERIVAVKEEAKRVGLNRQATSDLIATYGAIPKKKTTELLLDGIKGVVQALQGLYLYQRSLATGHTVSQTAHEIANEKGLPKGFQGPVKGPDGKYYAEGGWTGPGSKYQPAGVVHANEWVQPSESVTYYGAGVMSALQKRDIPAGAMAALASYARGGQVAPVDTSRRWPFAADVSGTKVMSRAEAASKVTPAFGGWPSSPAAQRGDSGVWRRILAVTRAAGFNNPLLSGYRPGDPLWHGSGRADDLGGFNQDPLAQFWAAKRPLELIHRSDERDYAYTRGVNKGSFNNTLMEAHRNHVHVAMDDGGFRMLQPGMNLIPNWTGRPEPIAGPRAMAAMSGGGEVHFHFHNSVVTSERQAVELVTRAYKTAKNERKIP